MYGKWKMWKTGVEPVDCMLDLTLGKFVPLEHSLLSLLCSNFYYGKSYGSNYLVLRSVLSC